MDLLKTIDVGPFSDLSIAALQADDAACGNYRIVHPMEMLKRGGANVGVFKEIRPGTLEPYDIILAQRQYSTTLLETLMHYKRSGKIVVYEIDDDVHAVHRNAPAYQTFHPGSEALKNVEKYLKSLDGFFCTTPELASAYGPYAKRSYVLPNFIDFSIRNWDTPAPRDPRLEGKVVIGWAGSVSHVDDWQELLKIGDILRKYPQAVFVMISANQLMDMFKYRLNLPEDQVVTLDPVGFAEYSEVLSQFDIGLIPAINTKFNQSKSDLKILEYGAWGVPYIASYIPPYIRFHKETEGKGGGWFGDGTLERLIEDEKLRKEKGEFLKTYVRENCAMEANAYRWAEALRDVRDRTRFNPESEIKYYIPTNVGRNDACPCGSGSKYKKCCMKAGKGGWG